MPLIALPIFAPQRTADAAALKMQPAYRPKNCRRIKSCSSAHYGLHRFAAGNRLSERFLTCFSAPIAKGAHMFYSCAFPLIMPAIFRRKASQNILTATLMPPIYGVQRGFLLPGIITAAEILPRTAKNIFRFRRSELLLSLILKLLRITCLQSPFPLPEVNIAKAKR